MLFVFLYSNEPQRSSPTFFFKSVMSLSLPVSSLRLSLPTRTQSGLCSITRWDHYATKYFTGKSLLLGNFFVYNSGRANMECNCVSCVRIFNGVELPQCSTEPDRVTTLEYRLPPKSKSSNWGQSELRLLEKNLLGFDFPTQRCNTSDVSLWLN